jgi:quinol monooxygenase YgiN
MPPEAMPQVSDDELMMCNTLMIKKEYRDEYLTELRRVLPLARRLPACLSLEVGEVAGQPGTFVLSERWRSGAEYVNEILQLDFYQRYLKRTEPHYAAPRSVSVLQSVG